MLRKIFLTLFIFLFLIFSVNAQIIQVNEDNSVNPIVLFKEAQNLVSQDERVKARDILENLMQRFPNDFEIHGLYLEAIGTIVSNEVYREKAMNALEVYEKVPLAKRTENFYERYQIVLRDLGKLNEIIVLKDEVVRKFPRSKFAGQLRLMEASSEKNIVKSAELYESLLKDFENEKDIDRLYEIYFTAISKDFSKFDNEKIISIAERYEESLSEGLNSQKLDVSKYRYLKSVLDISNKLREKHPEQSLRFAKKGLKIFENMKPESNIKVFEILLLQALFSSQIDLEKWEDARKIGLQIIEWKKNLAPDASFNEANFYKNYACVLENLNETLLAREYLFTASLMDKKFLEDWKEFDTKYPLLPKEKVVFEKSINKKFENFLDSRDSFVKAKLLETEQNIVASNFRLENLDGKEVSLKDYEGKILIMNFWATWCEPCVGELELMKEAYRKYENNPKVAFAFVSTDKNKEKVSLEIEKRGYEFPIFYSNEKLESDYKTDPIPRMVIIDAQGNIKFQIRGFNNNGYYLKELDWMIEAAMK